MGIKISQRIEIVELAVVKWFCPVLQTSFFLFKDALFSASTLSSVKNLRVNSPNMNGSVLSFKPTCWFASPLPGISSFQPSLLFGYSPLDLNSLIQIICQALTFFIFTARYKPVIFEISRQTGVNILTTLFTLKNKTQISKHLFDQNWQISRWKISLFCLENEKNWSCFFYFQLEVLLVGSLGET